MSTVSPLFDKEWKIKSCLKCKTNKIHVFQNLCKTCIAEIYNEANLKIKNYTNEI